MSENNEKSRSEPANGLSPDEQGERNPSPGEALTLPSSLAGSGTLDRLVDTARGYAKASTAENTNKAYGAD